MQLVLIPRAVAESECTGIEVAADVDVDYSFLHTCALMLDVDSLALRLASALAIGLLIGAERERRKGEGPSRSPTGIRTFAIASLIGRAARGFVSPHICPPTEASRYGAQSD